MEFETRTIMYFMRGFFYHQHLHIYTSENKKGNHQVGIFLCTWDLNQQERVQRGYNCN